MFILIHSPLVGPLTWQLVVKELEKQDITAIAPSLHTQRDDARLYWQQHRDMVVDSLTGIEEELVTNWPDAPCGYLLFTDSNGLCGC